ncbi:MAG: phosphoglucosamine mutase [Bacteroidales bacterium]
MALIHSISGIRGTIGGRPGEGLSPADVMRFTGAYAMWLRSRHQTDRIQVVIGRDARLSGPLVSGIVVSTLQAMGIDTIDAGLSTTPTIEMGVLHHGAQGGVIITASHNPMNWNALKLLNEKGEFMTAAEGEEMHQFMDLQTFDFVAVNKLGKYLANDTLLEMHIEKIMDLPLVDTDAIRNAGFTIVVDGINSSGGIAVPLLLEALGVKRVVEVYCSPTGRFQHNPEPLPEHLQRLSSEVVSERAHLGFAVDPDVDRLAIVSEDGEMFGEEYTLVAVADYVLSNTPGNTVSNLSSTQALAEITARHGGEHFYSAVGEVNVVEAMKAHHAVIGGEGNGGVIYPALHNGRDALVGIALFLTQLAKSKLSCSRLKKKYPEFYMSKNKIELSADVDLPAIIEKLGEKYSRQPIDRVDGLKIWFDREWIHLRLSNTEPVIRLYAESDSPVKVDHIAEKVKRDISEILKDL